MTAMLRNTETGYGLVAIVFHWTIAVLFAGQVTLGIFMTGLADDERAKFGLYQWHKSFGLLILGWAFVSSSPLGIPTFAFYLVVVPHLPVPVSEAAEAVLQRVHTSLALLSAAVAVVHIGAALRHHFVLKDAVLRRMIVPAHRRRVGRRGD
jgi:cytochrome b561